MSPFSLLNLIQFFAAINENLFRLLTAFFLIELLGENHTDNVMASIGALFILPFLLFSNLGGILADKFRKNHIVIATRALELLLLCIALFVFGLKMRYATYLLLFLMATFSALFGPTKYGIIPELVSRPRILYANSVIAAFTFLGIIFGTTLASFISWVTKEHYVLAISCSVFISLNGLILSFLLPNTPVENKEKPFRAFIYAEIGDALKQMKSIPHLLSVSIAYSYFLFIGAFVQLNIIPYTLEELGFSDIIGGYFFLLTSLGLGFGAYLTNKLSHNVIHLKMIPWSGIGISLILILMNWLYSPWWLMIPWMLILGFLGGIFLVPAQAFLIAKSPSQDRGRNFATANFLSFAFALLASFAIYLLNTTLELKPSTSFLVVGILNTMIMILFFRVFSAAQPHVHEEN